MLTRYAGRAIIDGDFTFVTNNAAFTEEIRYSERIIRSKSNLLMPADPLSILKAVFGYDSFRGRQREIIEHVIAANHAFVLMPTGGGKSLCYQIPALARPGVGLVISPLIALMEDQVAALRQAGVKAAALNS